ncbi:MAG: DUF523 domain-containing protein [Gammaproteobacteria bacterium]|nr:DUF523 domain-containing protein [Gammaproteobacteria bacterium]
MDDDTHKPKIAISGCIIGQQVRYDGALKHFADIHQFLLQHAELIPVCPEVEIGLSVPRPAVQLTGSPQRPAMTGRDNPALDISPQMYAFCKHKPLLLSGICGYVFKSKSPSCGIRNIPVFDHGEIISTNNRGLFAQAMFDHYPELPIIDETLLTTDPQRHQFLQQVLNYCHNRPTTSA